MHNQDQTKDDFMEMMMEILGKIQEHYKKLRQRSSEELKEDISQEVVYDDEKILRFQKVMKEVITDTDKNEIKQIAQTFHDNPIESMKMLQSLISEQTISEARQLVNLTKETSVMLESIRSNINIADPNATEQLAIINHLNIKENKKLELAESVLVDLKPLEREEGISKVVYDEKESKELLSNYFEKLEHVKKDMYEYEHVDFKQETNTLSVYYDHKQNRGYSGMVLKMNLLTGNGEELQKSTSESKGDFVSEYKVINTFSIDQLRKLKNNLTTDLPQHNNLDLSKNSNLQKEGMSIYKENDKQNDTTRKTRIENDGPEMER